MSSLGARTLRKLGIRGKILAVLTLPVLVMALLASIIAFGAVQEASAAKSVHRLTAIAPGIRELVVGLQGERTLSLAVAAGDTSQRPMLEDVRAKIDAGMSQVRGGSTALDLSEYDDSTKNAIASAIAGHDSVPGIRKQVDNGTMTPSEASTAYGYVITADVYLGDAIANLTDDAGVASANRAYAQVMRLSEYLAQEGDLAMAGIAAGGYNAELKAGHGQLVNAQNALRASLDRQLDDLGLELTEVTYSLQQGRWNTVEDADGRIEGLTVAQWRGAVAEEQEQIDVLLNALLSTIDERAQQIADDATARAWQIGGGAVLAVLLPLLLALYIARGITRPLRRLTEAAAEIRTQLPEMVERMATPGEGPGVELPEIPVESEDEVGRLAAAFNDVNSTTVAVAQEQAALRGSIAAMFVNVARRDQVLLSRQLAFIDQLERAEENPATLENLFKLDHLATRMRRNAESLLVLAGIDTGRRLRRPMPLSDVIRTASSEIENYERIDLALRVDPPMVGHMALSTAHLLAELLENATRFSDPETRVVVSTGSSDKGVVVTVTDDGLGMSPEELAEANASISDHAATEVVGAQRLGFFVVGRLARKLDAKVHLKAGRSRGTIVTIELSPALFVSGSVVQAPADASTAVDDSTTAISLPDTAAAQAPAAAPAPAPLPPAPEPPVAPPAPVAPAVTDDGLPRRGSGGLPSRQRSRVPSVPPVPAQASAPVAPAPVAPAPPVPAPSALAESPTGLPRRSRGATTAPAAPAPVAPSAPSAPVAPVPVAPSATDDAAPARPGGLFSGFRARRPGDDAPTGPSTDPAGVEDLVSDAPVLEGTDTDTDLAPLTSGTHVEAVAEAAVLEAPEVEAPVVEAPVVEAPVVEAQLAEAPVAEVEPAIEVLVPRTSDEPYASPVAADPAEVEPAAPAPVVAPAPLAATPAVNILPGGGARGRLLGGGRRHDDLEPVQPMTRREMRRLESGEGTAPSEAPLAPASAAAPAPAPAPSRRPEPAAPLGLVPSQHRSPAEPALAPPPAPPAAPVAAPAPAMPPPSLFGTTPDDPAPVPTPALDGGLRQRSALASEALAELSMLSSYSPAAVEVKPPSTLSRRTPASTPAAEVSIPRPAPATRRARNASDVRSMLSGFQAGVARGRTSPSGSPHESLQTPQQNS